jgi:hypothetical protein
MGARILPSFNFLEKKIKSLVSGGIHGFSRCRRSRKRIYPGDDWPPAGLFFVLKTEATVNREVVFLAGNPPASWHFINQ